MKKILCVLLVVLMVAASAFTFTACDNSNKYNTELIENGDFEQTGNTLLYWYESKQITSTKDGVLDIKTYPDAEEDNENYLEITNGSTTGNYIKVYQQVEVKRNGIYKIKAKVFNDTLEQGGDDTYAGAGIEILESEDILYQNKEITGDWTEITFYVKAKNCKTLTVALIFGNAKAKTIGTVAFDDVSMMRVKASDVPDSAAVTKIFKIRTPQYKLSTSGGVALVTVLAILTALLFVGAYYAYRKFIGDDKPILNKSWITAIILGVFAIALRLVLAGTLFDEGKAAYMLETLRDIVNNGGSRILANHPEMSPFQAYYYWIIGKIVYGWTNLGAVNVMAYLFPALCEGVTVATLYLFGKKYVNDKQAVLFSALYAVLPVSVVAGSGLNIELPVLTLLLFVTFYALIEKDYIMLLAGSLVTCLWSEVGVYVLPFIVVYEIYMMVKTKDKKLIITMCVGWFLSFWMFILLSAPAVKNMFVEGHIMYIFKPYYLMMFNDQICVSNAFNIYALFGLNGNAVNKAAFWLNIVFTVILLIYAVSLYFKNYNRAEMTLIAGFFLSVIAVFSLNMNEIALAVSIILLLMYIIVSGDERLFWVLGLLSLLAFVNIGIVMNYSGALGEAYNYTFFNRGDTGYAIANVLAGITVIVYGWFVYDITTNGKKIYLKPLAVKDASAKIPESK